MSGPAAIAAGIGCRRACLASDVVDALRSALAAVGCELGDVHGLFAPEFKRVEAGLLSAAKMLDKPIHFVSLEELHCKRAATLSTSQRALERYGVPSVAETAALAGACASSDDRSRARLLGPRVASGGVTCALAVLEKPSFSMEREA